MSDLDHCEAPGFPCWEHYGPHYATQRPVKWVIDLAEAALRFRMQTLPTNPEIEDLQIIQAATWSLINLKNQQWRDCVREPFQFFPGEGTETASPKDGKGSNLLALLGLKLVTPIKRRQL